MKASDTGCEVKPRNAGTGVTRASPIAEDMDLRLKYRKWERKTEEQTIYD